MLYATTRSKVETFTAQRALKETFAPDGGLYVPTRLPEFSQEEILELSELGTGECIARVMNRFFGTRLTEREVEFRLGRNACYLRDMSHRIAVAETWHNNDGSFGRTVRVLTGMVSAELGVSSGQWMTIAARIAVIFALYGELVRMEMVAPGGAVDASVPDSDMSVAMAYWYARKMGLPIGCIVVCCDDDRGLWQLIARGQIKPGKNPPAALERLIFGTLGQSDTEQYVRCCRDGGLFALGREKHRTLRDGLYACVVSPGRTMSVIANVCRTNGTILDPVGAVTHAGIMDYRAITGSSNPALILCEESPVLHETEVCAALGIGSNELRRRLNVL